MPQKASIQPSFYLNVTFDCLNHFCFQFKCNTHVSLCNNSI
nr:MAG TPA: hypothetical protein [Caudoviricetes sp.]